MIDLERHIRDISTTSPDRLAIRYRNQAWNYGQLAAVLTGLDQRMPPVAGRRIVLLMPDGMSAYLCHLYFFLRGAIVVPLTVQTTTAKLEAICDLVQPHLVVTNGVLRARHGAALEGLPMLAAKGESGVAWGFDFDLFGCDRLVGGATASDDLRLIVFTSGSTGEPKGVCLGASCLLAAAGMNVGFLGLDSTRKSVVTVPLYDYYGFIQIYSHLLARTGYVLGESLAFPNSVFQKIHDERATDLVLVPHTLRELVRSATRDQRETLCTLQYVTSSSDALGSELLKKVFEVSPGLKIVNIYGLTEAGRACFRLIEANSPPSNSIGRPAPGVEVVIEHSSDRVGEIIIRGPNVMLGYFQGIEDDRVTWKPCTEMRTGDLGYRDERGEIVLLGRRDHMFNLKGVKIHPLEIEQLALQVAGVTDAQARTATDANGDVVILLDVVPADGTVDVDLVKAHLRKHLSPAFLPRDVNVVSGLKRTELGSKVIREKSPA